MQINICYKHWKNCNKLKYIKYKIWLLKIQYFFEANFGRKNIKRFSNSYKLTSDTIVTYNPAAYKILLTFLYAPYKRFILVVKSPR